VDARSKNSRPKPVLRICVRVRVALKWGIMSVTRWIPTHAIRCKGHGQGFRSRRRDGADGHAQRCAVFVNLEVFICSKGTPNRSPESEIIELPEGRASERHASAVVNDPRTGSHLDFLVRNGEMMAGPWECKTGQTKVVGRKRRRRSVRSKQTHVRDCRSACGQAFVGDYI